MSKTIAKDMQNEGNGTSLQYSCLENPMDAVLATGPPGKLLSGCGYLYHDPMM